MSTVTIPTAVLKNARPRSDIQLKAVLPSLLLMLSLAAYIAQTVRGRQAWLFLVGAAAGVVLYHAAFGFTSSWRTFITDRRGAGLRAQMLMLAVACAMFVPALASGSLLGQTVRGSISPVGWAVVAGAFMFGAGMQLGGGCASGTLYAAGGGSIRMLATLAAFIGVSVIGTLHTAWWAKTAAVIGFGCNIGAYFGGVVSTSLHGWLWLAAALAGSVLGTRVRPWFGLSVH